MSDTPDNDLVICPNCVHQFRAIPVNVQRELAEATDLLNRFFDRYEGGDGCYEHPDSAGGYMGQCVRLDGDLYDAIVSFLDRHCPETEER